MYDLKEFHSIEFAEVGCCVERELSAESHRRFCDVELTTEPTFNPSYERQGVTYIVQDKMAYCLNPVEFEFESIDDVCFVDCMFVVFDSNPYNVSQIIPSSVVPVHKDRTDHIRREYLSFPVVA